MCCYGNMFDHGCASLVFLWSAMVVYPCDIHKASRLLAGKKGQLKKEVPSVAMMTNFGFGPRPTVCGAKVLCGNTKSQINWSAEHEENWSASKNSPQLNEEIVDSVCSWRIPRLELTRRSLVVCSTGIWRLGRKNTGRIGFYNAVVWDQEISWKITSVCCMKIISRRK